MPQKPQMLTNPLTNRGTAFTHEERARLGLIGRLPAAVETLDQQAARAYKSKSAPMKPIWKNTFISTSCTTATKCCITA